jgi:hypothetical protein
MSGICERCGREWGLDINRAHDCVEYLLGIIRAHKEAIDQLQGEIANLQREYERRRRAMANRGFRKERFFCDEKT